MLRSMVDAKNVLENKCLQMKNTLTNEKLAAKYTAEDKTAIEAIVSEGLQFMESGADPAAIAAK